ncbi:unnamed protein product [Boreogadus saida]
MRFVLVKDSFIRTDSVANDPSLSHIVSGPHWDTVSLLVPWASDSRLPNANGRTNLERRPAHQVPTFSFSQGMLPARRTTWTPTGTQTLRPHFKSEEYCDAFGDRSTQRGATSESLGVDAPGSSHMSSHSGELRILNVYGKGEGPLAEDGHDTLFTASEVEALNSLSADHSAAKSLERGERLVCREELSVQQQTPDTISIKVEEDIGGDMPAGDGNDIRDCSTQRGATSESLRVDAPGSSHMSSHSGELRILSVYGQGEGPLAEDGHDTLFTASEVEALNSLSADHSAAKSLERGERLVCHEELSVQQTPDTISIKVEEDIGGGWPTVEDCDAFGDRSTQRGATSESLRVDAPGSSHMSSHSGELRILSVYGQGEGPLAVDCHDTLFAASEPEALNSLSADHSVAKSLNCSVRLVHLEELTGHRGGRKGRPDVLCGKVFPNNADMIVPMRTHNDEKPYRVSKYWPGYRVFQRGNLMEKQRNWHASWRVMMRELMMEVALLKNLIQVQNQNLRRPHQWKRHHHPCKRKHEMVPYGLNNPLAFRGAEQQKPMS